MKKIIVLLLSLFVFSFSQRLSHPLHAAGGARSIAAINDTLKILAIMVQFQKEEPDNELTSGDGTFDVSTPAEPVIDASPHNTAYFQDHFAFAENYFTKASNGKQHITATVLPNVLTLSKQMREYAPLNGNRPLVNMIEEAWQSADATNPGFPFGDYNLFVIFHAGVGRDVDLRASLGYDPTPYDLPSLYFNLSAFKNIYENDFAGFPVQDSAFSIQNTIVLPETEVRKIPGIIGEVTLKLGINGLLVASIASYLGLPDLFDTKTGRTAIGRFGLMDGQAIFSFSGICPPEPSAWEKAYLGWTMPIEVYGNTTLPVPAVGLYQTGNDTVYRIPISAKEYFLVENRQRDAKGNGQTVSMRWNGNVITKTFTRDEDFYSNTSIDSIYGNVMDVDELDWSLPGGFDEENNKYYGGILIWHVDETIIEKNLLTNSINANPAMRGVDVEEADGSQDIGKSYDIVSPGAGSEDGAPLDYWFNGNISPVYKNEFSETTFPNSLSNSFAKSHITLKNFSSSSPRMTFEVSVGDSKIQLMKVIKRQNLKLDNNDAPLAADLNGDGKEELIYTSGDSIYVLKNDLTPYLNNTTGLFYPKGGRFQPAYATYRSFGNHYVLAGVSDSSVFVWDATDNSVTVADTLNFQKSQSIVSTPPQSGINTASNIYFFRAGTENGDLVIVTSGTNNILPSSGSSSFKFFSQAPSSAGLYPVYIFKNKFMIEGKREWDFPNQNILSAAVGRLETTKDSTGFYGIVVTDDDYFYLLNTTTLQQSRYTLQGISGALAIADVDENGTNDIVLGNNAGLFAFNRNGTLIENFPLKILDGGKAVGSPVVVKLTGSNETAILFGSTNGQLYAYTSKGRMVDGFPLQTGGIVSSPVLWGDKLVVASSDTSLYVWKVGNLFDTSKVLWGNFLGDKYHSNFVESAGNIVAKSSELLPKKFAYNWPNPAYGGTTNIRYYLGKSATVKIKIVNLAGELVDEMQGTNDVGLDNEVQWNISKVQSGIYFAQITASGNGEEQSQIIKIAVVK